MYILIYIYICIYTDISIYMHIYIHIFIHIHIHVHVYIYIHTCIYTLAYDTQYSFTYMYAFTTDRMSFFWYYQQVVTLEFWLIKIKWVRFTVIVVQTLKVAIYRVEKFMSSTLLHSKYQTLLMNPVLCFKFKKRGWAIQHLRLDLVKVIKGCTHKPHTHTHTTHTHTTSLSHTHTLSLSLSLAHTYTHMYFRGTGDKAFWRHAHE